MRTVASLCAARSRVANIRRMTSDPSTMWPNRSRSEAGRRTLLNLGNLTADLGDFAAALPFLERALAIRRKTLRAGHPAIARALTELGRLHADRGHPETAIPLLEEALGILGNAPDNAPQVAKTRFALAQTYWRSGCEEERATRLAAEARAGFVAHGMASWAAEVDGWPQRRKHVACAQNSHPHPMTSDRARSAR